MEKELQKLILQDYRLTTAEILYHLPDHPTLLQQYIWQDFDRQPEYPELAKFLSFWQREMEGKLHSVTIARCELIRPANYIASAGSFTIH